VCMPGPLQNPNARRRRLNASQAMHLPAERLGPEPGWPLETASAAENEVWQQIWKLPQAVVWGRQSWLRVVARYVRLAVACEQPGVKAALLSECRQLEDRLGLNPVAAARLHWEIDPPIDAAVTPTEARPPRRLSLAEYGDED
jgi:hypothetical protein